MEQYSIIVFLSYKNSGFNHLNQFIMIPKVCNSTVPLNHCSSQSSLLKSFSRLLPCQSNRFMVSEYVGALYICRHYKSYVLASFVSKLAIISGPLKHFFIFYFIKSTFECNLVSICSYCFSILYCI